MNQKQRKLKQAREDVELLEGLKITAISCGHTWHRLRRMIEAKQLDIKRMEGNHDKNNTAENINIDHSIVSHLFNP